MYNRPNMQKYKTVVYCSSRANRGHIITYTKIWLKSFTHSHVQQAYYAEM